MGKPVLHIIFTFLLQFVSAQQNLVPNPSFEDTLHCPTGTNDAGAVSFWYNPTMASPDYYNSCSVNGAGVPLNDWGYQYAQDGSSYIGICTYYSTISNYREYMQVKLTEKLEAGRTYCWSFWISLLDSTDFASNNIGIGLSENPVTNFSAQSILSVSCIGAYGEIYADRNHWKQVSGTYTALGNEEFLTIGNLFNDQNTQFVQVASNSIGGQGAYYFIDNIIFGNCKTQINVPNIFSPNGDGINDYFMVDAIGVSDFTLIITNRWGNEIYYGQDKISWDGRSDNGRECNDGVYFYNCTYKNIQLDKYETKTGFIQLVR